MTSLQQREARDFPFGGHPYVVLSKKQETPTTSTLTLVKTDGSIPAFSPGQYMTVYFPDLSQTLGKQYSISSAPREHTLSITVKAIGRFSNRLCSLETGDTVVASGPGGNFYPHTPHTIVMLAGGMGIMPFRSLIFEVAQSNPSHRMILFYGSKLSTDMPFGEELHNLSLCLPTLTVEQFVTQKSKSLRDAKYRRVRIDDIIHAVAGNTVEYLISGSLSFVLEVKNMLLTHGIKRNSLRTEAHS